MPIARMVAALAVPVALLAGFFMTTPSASGAILVQSAWASVAVHDPQSSIIVSGPLQFGIEDAYFVHFVTSGPLPASFLGSALFEQSLSLSWEGAADATSLVSGSAELDFEVDTTGTYRFAGTSENAAGGQTHAELSLDGTILAEVGLEIGQAGPTDLTHDVVLIAGQTYSIDFTGSLSQPSAPASATLAISLTPVPEPGCAALLGVGVIVLLLHGARRRMFFG